MSRRGTPPPRWRPPYLGAESGSVTIWGSSPYGTSLLRQLTVVGSGNVSVYYVSYSNLTVFDAANTTVSGSGESQPCASSLLAFFSPNPAQGMTSGGITWIPLGAGHEPTDEDLPTQLNASALCSEVENTSYAGCAVGTQFDMNFQTATGSVDTCGQSQGQVLDWKSDTWPVRVPFEHGGQVESVPVDPSGADQNGYSNGTYAYYNYTFPANGGVWHYDDLAVTSNTGAGLTFSYSPC